MWNVVRHPTIFREPRHRQPRDRHVGGGGAAVVRSHVAQRFLFDSGEEGLEGRAAEESSEQTSPPLVRVTLETRVPAIVTTVTVIVVANVQPRVRRQLAPV
ncbi:unnamed protein product [Lampetra fluviatilis]